MLKIYINNEEVIANQNFTIQKHMLNTPSVILNNVCPKTWCDEKDYITNFYHPLDYSKCKIVDETFHPYDPGITTTINQSATLNNVDTTKLYELTQIEGNTTQASTPTPSSPVPINVVSGRQEIDIVGKNLFDKDNANILQVNLSNSTTISGNSTSNRTLYISIQPNTTYTISKIISNYFVIGTTKSLPQRNLAYYQRQANASANSLTITTNSTAKYLVCWFWNSSDTLTEQEILDSIQIEKGSTATEYEEYKGQSYEINLGKNLNFTPYKDGTSKSTNGIQFTVNSDGSITANNTATAIAYFYCHTHDATPYLNIEKGVYFLSGGVSANCKLNLRLYNNTTYVANFTDSGNGVVVDTRNYTYNRIFLFVQIESGTQCDNVVFKPMLEKGNVATTYAPYKTPIELCKIGTYQDRIYKENGTWYLHKEIGKVVLNGSESWVPQSIKTNTTAYALYNNIGYKATGSNSDNAFINYFKGNPNGYNVDEECFWFNGDGYFRLRISNTLASTVAQFKTWLSTHNTIVYYVLATPTTTEITDTELISQLNAIELLEGLNNISITSGNLPGIMTIHYNFNDAYTTEDLLFCGVVKNSGNISLNPREPHYTTLQVLDFKDFLSSGETLDFVIYQKTILEAIQQVIGTIQDYGFILGNVNILNPNEIIGAYSTKDKTAYDVFNYIADITQSRWTTRMIDENTVAIDFYDPTLMPQGTEINYTNAYFNDKLIDDMKYSYGTNNYRNKQVMISKQVYSNISQAQTIVANGYQTQFPTEQPIGKINSITSNGIPLTFATFNEKDMGYVADFYYTPGDNYFESDDLRSTGEVLIIDYVAIVEGRQVITNSTEIDRIQESTGRKGIIARYETRNDATTSTELQKIGESYIKYKGTPEIVLTIQSRKNTWEVGQRVQFNAPIDELDTEYMVRSKKINYIANQQENESQLFYTYELISSFNSETEINYFDNQRAKTSGNIGEGEYISRNIDIESTAEIIFYDTETTEVQVSGDNELNAILNSPFIS